MDNEEINNKIKESTELLDYRKGMNVVRNKQNESFSSKDILKLLQKTNASIVCFSYENALKKTRGTQLISNLLNNSIEIHFINNSFSKLLKQYLTIRNINKFTHFFPSTDVATAFLIKWQEEDYETSYIDITFNLNGINKVFEIIMYPVNENNSNFFTKFWMVCHDVTESRRLINKISNQEMHYRKLLEQPGLMLVRISVKNELLYFSDYLLKILGYTNEEFKENINSISKLVHPEDLETFKQLRLVRNNKASTSVCVEYRIKNKNQEYQWLHQRQMPKKDMDGLIEYYDSVILDINEKKKLEVSLLHSQRMEVVGQMASQVSHDFNNHLTTILGQITLALQNLNNPAKAIKNLKYAEKATLACGEMSKNLLSFGKKGNKKTSVIYLIELLEETIKLAKNSIPSSINLSLSIGLGVDKIWGNHTELQQVLINLILNSKDAILSKGRIHIEVNKHTIMPEELIIEPKLKINQSYIEIKVTDNGIGIKEQNIPFVFDPYFSTKSNSHSGLGLSSVYSIIKEHDGIIKVESKQTKGCEFLIILPECTEGKNFDRNTKNNKIIIKKSLNILFADDDEMLSDMTKALLKSNGHKVFHAQNGKDAIKLFKKLKNEINFAFIDYTMPIYNGREVIEFLHKEKPELPILLTSGLSNFALKNKRNLEFLAKPYHLDQLTEKMSKMIKKVKS